MTIEVGDEFHGRVAVVTGGSSGIGRAAAELLLRHGARVAVASRSIEPLRELASGGRMLAIRCDVGTPESVERLFAEVETRFGPCELLVNSAGTIQPLRIRDMTPAQWDEQISINLNGTFYTCRRALSQMKRGGAIVNVASISGIPGPQKFTGFAAYCAAKGGVIAFTECLAVEAKEHGIRANCVSPGSVDTPMLRRASEALRPDMTAAEVAETILFLLSDRSRPMNGQNIHVFSS